MFNTAHDVEMMDCGNLTVECAVGIAQSLLVAHFSSVQTQYKMVFQGDVTTLPQLMDLGSYQGSYCLEGISKKE